MWVLIFSAMFIAAGTAVIYLTSRFHKFAYVDKCCGDKKAVRILLAALPVVLVGAFTGCILGAVNAIIIFIHWMVIWFGWDLVKNIKRKKRRTEFKRY